MASDQHILANRSTLLKYLYEAIQTEEWNDYDEAAKFYSLFIEKLSYVTSNFSFDSQQRDLCVKIHAVITTRIDILEKLAIGAVVDIPIVSLEDIKSLYPFIDCLFIKHKMSVIPHWSINMDVICTYLAEQSLLSPLQKERAISKLGSKRSGQQHQQHQQHQQQVSSNQPNSPSYTANSSYSPGSTSTSSRKSSRRDSVRDGRSRREGKDGKDGKDSKDNKESKERRSTRDREREREREKEKDRSSSKTHNFSNPSSNNNIYDSNDRLSVQNIPPTDDAQLFTLQAIEKGVGTTNMNQQDYRSRGEQRGISNSISDDFLDPTQHSGPHRISVTGPAGLTSNYVQALQRNSSGASVGSSSISNSTTTNATTSTNGSTSSPYDHPEMKESYENSTQGGLPSRPQNQTQGQNIQNKNGKPKPPTSINTNTNTNTIANANANTPPTASSSTSSTTTASVKPYKPTHSRQSSLSGLGLPPKTEDLTFAVLATTPAPANATQQLTHTLPHSQNPSFTANHLDSMTYTHIDGEDANRDYSVQLIPPKLPKSVRMMNQKENNSKNSRGSRDSSTNGTTGNTIAPKRPPIPRAGLGLRLQDIPVLVRLSEKERDTYNRISNLFELDHQNRLEGALISRSQFPFGYSRLQIDIEKAKVPNPEQMIDPFITISMYDDQRELVDEVQHTPVAKGIDVKGGFICFQQIVDFNVPVEAFDSNWIVVFELKHFKESKGGYISTKCWTIIDCPLDQLEGLSVELPFYKKPTDLKLKNKKPYMDKNQQLHLYINVGITRWG